MNVTINSELNSGKMLLFIGLVYWYFFFLFIDFKEVYDEFEEVIQSAAFFSIDSEFTGLFSERTLPFSTPSEFYKKLHAGTDDFIIIQV